MNTIDFRDAFISRNRLKSAREVRSMVKKDSPWAVRVNNLGVRRCTMDLFTTRKMSEEVSLKLTMEGSNIVGAADVIWKLIPDSWCDVTKSLTAI